MAEVYVRMEPDATRTVLNAGSAELCGQVFDWVSCSEAIW